MLKKIIIIAVLLLSSSIAFSQIKGGKIVVTPKIINYTLTVNSNVKPYTVYVDGRQISGTQITLESGNHSIMVTSDGYYDYKTSINLTRNTVITAALKREIKNAHVSFFIPSSYINNNLNGAINQIKIFDNGRLLKGYSFEMTPGNHTIRVESGGLVIESNYNFLPGKTYKIEPVLYLNIE